MGINEIIKPIKKSLVLSIRVSYQSICNHPILIIFTIFFLFLYKYFPSLFSLLISTSPVLICTTLLMGTLLSYGQPNYPQIEEEEQIRDQISTRNLQIKPNLPLIEQEEQISNENSTRDLQFEPNFPQIGHEEQINNETSSRDFQIKPNLPQIGEEIIQIKPNEISQIQNEPNITERELEGVFFNEEFATSYPKPEEKDKFSQERETQERETQERETQDFQTILKSKSSIITRALSLNETSFEDHIDSPQWQRLDHQENSDLDVNLDFESEGEESSSPDASMSDIIPLLEEIDPLLNLNSNLNSQTPKIESDNESNEFIDENSNDDDDDDYDDKMSDKKDESRENAFNWTDDDKKNVMDLGYSELERNQRLENLMQRRRSRKNVIFEPNKNLIDLNSNPNSNSSPRTFTGIDTGTDDFSKFRVSVPPISVSKSKSNPFDFDFDSGPGSAPSVLNPRRNPFDLFTPYEEPKESSIFSKDSFAPKEFMNMSHSNTLFKRYDSFNHSSLGFAQERAFSRLKPYFTPNNNNDNDGDNGDGGLDSPIMDPLSKEEERENEERESESDNEDINSVNVELDQSEFEESNGERESPNSNSRGFEYLLSLQDETPLVPDLLVWDDEPAEATLGASSSTQPTNFEENYNTGSDPTHLTRLGITMDLHSIPEEGPIEDPKPDKTDKPGLITESDPNVDSDEDAERIFPEPIDETLLRELDEVGDFAPRQHVLGFSSTVSDAIRVSNGTDPEQTVYNPRRHVLEASSVEEINALFNKIHDESKNEDLDSRILCECEETGNPIPGLVEGNENPGNGNSGIEETGFDTFDDFESAIMQANANDEVGLIGETKSGVLIMKAKTKADIESVFKQVGEFLGKSNPGFGEDSDSGMMSLDAKSLDDIDLAIYSVNKGNEDDELIDETESGMLIMKAKSKEDIESVFKQVEEVLGNSNPGFEEDSDILALDAKSIEDIDSAMYNMNEGNEDSGLIDETDSGLLIMKAKSKEDIKSVFKQVGEVLGKSNLGNGNPGFQDDSNILVLDAKSIHDIDSAMLQMSENLGNEDSGLVDETDSGLLIMKAKSKEDIKSVFKQVGEVLGKPNPGFGEDSDSGLIDETESGLLIMKAKSKEDIESVFKQVGEVLGNSNPGFEEDSNSEILTLDAKSIEDIDSVMLQMSENLGNVDSGLVDETDSGLLIMKAKSKEDIEAVFKQVGEVLVNSNPGFEEDSNSGILTLDAKSIEDIDSVMLQMSENLGNEDSGLVDETDSGLLIMKAKSKEEIETVFKQVGEVLGKSNPGFENPGIDLDSGIQVLDAKSINDIDSAILNAIEDKENNQFDETENGMLVINTKSLEDMDSLFNQVNQVLGKQDPGFVENPDSEILVLDAKSINDIDSAILNLSEDKENNQFDETDNGMLVVNTKSLEDMDSLFKQVGEVLGKQDPGFENPGFGEETESGMLVVKAGSIEDINSAIKQASSIKEINGSNVEESI